MECKVRFADEKLKEAFEKVRNSDERLFKELEKAFNDICQNGYVGRNVKKKLIPKEFISKYQINNLWVYSLSKDWRLVYTLAGNEIEVLAIVLDWMNHKDYERLFKF